MKKQILAFSLALCLCSPFQQTAYAGQGNSLEQEKALMKKTADKSVTYIAEYTETDVYNAIIKMKDIYPDGMTWNLEEPYSDENPYLGNGYIFRGGRNEFHACSAFSYGLSDVAFGCLPTKAYSKEKDEVKFEDIRVGDVLTIYSSKGLHSLIVLENSDDGLVVAEGNASGKVRWERKRSKDYIMERIISYQTRYSENYKKYISPDNLNAKGAVTSGAVSNYVTKFTQEDIYYLISKLKRLNKFQEGKYEEGTVWTDDKLYGSTTMAYIWNGNGKRSSGNAAFAFKFNDELFGCLLGKEYARGEFKFEDIKVGDILQLNNDTDSVVVFEVNDNGVIVVEGNYNGNGKVSWGREISKDDIMNHATHYYTRYPEKCIVNENLKTDEQTEEPSVTISKDNVGEKVTVNNINYEIMSVEGTKTVKVTGIEKATKEVIIPSVIPFNKSRYKVTAIGSNAFKSNKNLLKIEIGTNINSIGENAFNGCKNLKNITIKSNKLVAGKVGKNAFKGINNNVIIKVPKKKIKAYKKIIKAAGAGKNIIVINLYMVYYGM